MTMMASFPRISMPKRLSSPRTQRPAINIFSAGVTRTRSQNEAELRRANKGVVAPAEADERRHSDASSSSGVATFRIAIPHDVVPGEDFQVIAGGRVVRVRCPPQSTPGQFLQISVPRKESDQHQHYQDSTGNGTSSISPELISQAQDSDNVARVPNWQLQPGEHSAYMVKIPEYARPGEQFPVTINGQPLNVNCPIMGRPGMSVRIVPPHCSDLPPQPAVDNNTQRFEVVVPSGVKPGQPFALLAGGIRVLVTCPTNAISGQKIQFDLPISLVNRPVDNEPSSKLAAIKLSYDKDGWTRTIRASDMKFQWTRFDERGNVDERTRFNTERSAYVLKLDFLDDNRHLREGRISLVTPDKGVVDSMIKRADGSDFVSYADIASAQMKSYTDKIRWFKDTCAQLHTSDRHMIMNIRREYLLTDSIDAVMSLSRTDLRRKWRFQFAGEAGLDVGGLKREWFELVTKAIFDPNLGMWQSSLNNQMCMQINPASGSCCPDDHLICFRFIGRVMGKALFDGELVKGHMVKHLYKHILGWPVMLSDLKDLDEVFYKNIRGLKDMGPDVEYLCLDFTDTMELLWEKQTVELIPGGQAVEVTENNLPEYIEALLKYRLMGGYEAQLRELLLGFYDVIDAPLLTIFDFQELELLMCGLPKIDVVNWIEHTDYSGEYDTEGPAHKVCTWFWDIVSEYDEEMKARLLQFVTATSGVPADGFGCLQGNDGNIRLFTIHGVTLDTCVYPRSHTCFNRIDLPLYETKDELAEKLKIAITMVTTGFDLE